MKLFNVYLLYLDLKLLFLRAVLGCLLLNTRSSWNEVCKIIMKLYIVVAAVYNNNHTLLLTQLLSHVWLFEIPWTAAGQTLSSTVSWSVLKFMSTELVILFNHLILCHPLLLLSLTFPSNRVFSSGSSHQVAEVLGFSFSISPSNEHSGLISFRIDWFDLHAVQGTLKSPLQHHNLKASVLWCSAFFMIQLSHLYTTTEKTRGLTRQIFSAKWCVCFLICCLGLS